MGPTYFKHIYAYFCIFSCMFIPIFKYISTYFYIFLLICIYLVLFSCISLHIFMYISTYFYIFTTKVWHFVTDCHKSVLFYYRLPQKCGILLQFTDIYHISVGYIYSLTQKCGIYSLICTRKPGTFHICTRCTSNLVQIWYKT